MLMNPRAGTAFVVLLSVVGGGLSRAGGLQSTAVDVCSVLAHPKEYSGRRLTIRGLLDFEFPSPPIPPTLLRGNCGHGPLLPITVSGPGVEDLWKAETEPSTDSSARRIWATVTGPLEVEGDKVFLSVDAVKDIVIRRNLAVKHALVPRFPSDADDTGGVVRVLLTVRKGAVTRAKVLGKADASLAREALAHMACDLSSSRALVSRGFRAPNVELC